MGVAVAEVQEEPSMLGGYMPDHHHDIPVAGIFTAAIGDAFAGDHDEAHLKACFTAIDTDKSGSLDKTEMAEAMRKIGQSERQIQMTIDRMPRDPHHELKFEEFKALMNDEEPREIMTSATIPGIGIEIPVPNTDKIYDVPVLGSVLSATGNMISMPVDGALRMQYKHFYDASDEALDATFKDLDTDKSGTLDKGEVAKGMRKWGNTEADIAAAIEKVTKPLTLYEFRKFVRGPKFAHSNIHYLPFGSAVHHNLIGNPEFSDEELKEAWDHIMTQVPQTGGTKKKPQAPKKLNKLQIGDVFHELGYSALQIQKIVDDMEPGVETFDFASFKELLEPKSRDYTTTLKGIPMPNPGKIHDVPVVGNVTALGQDAAVHAYGWTIGWAVSKFSGKSDEEVKESFDLVDTNKDGKLSPDEVAVALRDAGVTEVNIKAQLQELNGKVTTFDQFKAIVQG